MRLRSYRRPSTCGRFLRPFCLYDQGLSKWPCILKCGHLSHLIGTCSSINLVELNSMVKPQWFITTWGQTNYNYNMYIFKIILLCSLLVRICQSCSINKSLVSPAFWTKRWYIYAKTAMCWSPCRALEMSCLVHPHVGIIKCWSFERQSHVVKVTGYVWLRHQKSQSLAPEPRIFSWLHAASCGHREVAQKMLNKGQILSSEALIGPILIND